MSDYEPRYVEADYSTPNATKYLDQAIRTDEGDMMSDADDSKRTHWVDKLLTKAVDAEALGQ